MESLIQDIRYAVRMLWKAPGFTVIAILALALGIGANTVIFSVVNAVMLRPLPYPEADRLMMLFHSYPKINLPRASVSPLGFLYYREHAQSFESIGALTFFRGPQNLTAGGEPERVKTVLASAGVFPTLGVQPMLGRVFRAEEDQPGANRVAVLSYGLWKRRFGGDRGVLGQSISLDGANYTVVGVMPEGFQVPQGSELWLPLALDPQRATALGNEFLQVVARTKPGVTRAQVDAEMGSISQQLLQRDPEAGESGWHVVAEPITNVIRGPLRSALFVLLAAVACVLLVACANIANLLLSRATARMKEMAIRAAMGARRGRIIRQMLTESILLALLGGALGLLIGFWGIDALLKLVPLRLPTFSPVTLDTNVLAFTFGLAMLTGLIFGLFPAFQVSSGKLSETLKEGGRSSSVHGREGVRKALVIAEVAMALVLLIVAGLMIRSFIRIQQARFGFDPNNTLTAWVSLTRQRYNDDTKIRSFYQQLLQNVSTLPGVKHAAVGSSLPLVSDRTQSFDIQGMKLNPAPHAFFAVVSPEYFSALGIPFLTGRAFTESDVATSPPVCLIDDKLVRAYFRDENPIGKYIDDGTGPNNTPHWRQIIGVVGGVKHVSAVADETKGEVYIPFQQMPERTLSVVLRSDRDPQALTAALRRAVTQLDANQALYDVLPMEQYVDNFIAQPRFNMVLLGLFGGLALVLAAVGVYGVISYWVTQRTHEIGVRMALGAARGDVLQLVLRESLRLAAIGIGIGLVVALLATRALSGLLFGTSVRDPLTFTLLAAMLVGVAILASYVPARRAAKVDPMVALRYE